MIDLPVEIASKENGDPIRFDPVTGLFYDDVGFPVSTLYLAQIGCLTDAILWVKDQLQKGDKNNAP